MTTPTTPYFLRALYEWCLDNHLTPYVVVDAHTPGVQVPREVVRDGHIVLNMSLEATSGLKMDNELIEFKTRFSGVARQVSLPINSVRAIYASETGQGMSFDPVDTAAPPPSTASTGRKNATHTAASLSRSSSSETEGSFLEPSTESASSPSASHSTHSHLSLVSSQIAESDLMKTSPQSSVSSQTPETAHAESHGHVPGSPKPESSNSGKKPTLTLVK